MSSKPKHKCTECGDLFIPKPHTAGKFCSQKCYRKNQAIPKEQCLNCGKTFKPKVADRVTFCSRECAYAHKKANAKPKLKPTSSKVYFPECPVCKNLFTTKVSTKKYCSKKCSSLNSYYKNHSKTLKMARRAYRARNGIKPLEKECVFCGKAFKTYRERGKFCSRDCLHAHSRYMREPRHRAKALGVYYEPVNPLKVFIRDGWRCQQCGKKLNPNNRGKMQDNAPELDHILPWAQGGEHSYLNTQLLCRKCNGEKNSQPIGQMLMFGELDVKRGCAGA